MNLKSFPIGVNLTGIVEEAGELSAPSDSQGISQADRELDVIAAVSRAPYFLDFNRMSHGLNVSQSRPGAQNYLFREGTRARALPNKKGLSRSSLS